MPLMSDYITGFYIMKTTIKAAFLGAAVSLCVGNVQASETTDHAPIGVMGDHIHKEGEVMLSYRYMTMQMKGYREGTRQVSSADLFAQGYMVAPLNMTMQMHMLGAMYAPTDKLTMMAMVPYVIKSMDHLQNPMMGGQAFTTDTKGFGDVKISGLYSLIEDKLHAGFGVSIPTGSLNERDDTLMADQPLPYPMQLGSGTWDLLPSLTYVGHSESFSWGAQLSGIIRLGKNDNGYALGNSFAATAWLAVPVTEWASLSTRLKFDATGAIDGRDSNLPLTAPNMVPTADPANGGGERLDFLTGLNLLAPDGTLAGHRLAIEFGLPLVRNLNGFQMETDWTLTVGWQKAF